MKYKHLLRPYKKKQNWQDHQKKDLCSPFCGCNSVLWMVLKLDIKAAMRRRRAEFPLVSQQTDEPE
ncbi:MAG: hypothetical protein PVG96_13570 [Desulfobacterales bacterium]|jgi:sulfur transfer protein SufE